MVYYIHLVRCLISVLHHLFQNAFSVAPSQTYTLSHTGATSIQGNSYLSDYLSPIWSNLGWGEPNQGSQDPPTPLPPQGGEGGEGGVGGPLIIRQIGAPEPDSHEICEPNVQKYPPRGGPPGAYFRPPAEGRPGRRDGQRGGRVDRPAFDTRRKKNNFFFRSANEK